MPLQPSQGVAFTATSRPPILLFAPRAVSMIDFSVVANGDLVPVQPSSSLIATSRPLAHAFNDRCSRRCYFRSLQNRPMSLSSVAKPLKLDCNKPSSEITTTPYSNFFDYWTKVRSKLTKSLSSHLSIIKKLDMVVSVYRSDVQQQSSSSTEWRSTLKLPSLGTTRIWSRLLCLWFHKSYV